MLLIMLKVFLLFVLSVKGISCLTSYKYTTYLLIILISEKKIPFMLNKSIQILLSLRSNLPQEYAICASKYILHYQSNRATSILLSSGPLRDHSGTTPLPLGRNQVESKWLLGHSVHLLLHLLTHPIIVLCQQ